MLRMLRTVACSLQPKAKYSRNYLMFKLHILLSKYATQVVNVCSIRYLFFTHTVLWQITFFIICVTPTQLIRRRKCIFSITRSRHLLNVQFCEILGVNHGPRTSTHPWSRKKFWPRNLPSFNLCETQRRVYQWPKLFLLSV